MTFADIMNDVGHVLSTVLNASGIDSATKTQLQAKIDGVKQAAGAVVLNTAATVETVAADAPTLAGEAAGGLTTEAVDKVPGGSILAPMLSMVAQAAAQYAVQHFSDSLVAHNGDHIAAAEATLAAVQKATVAPPAPPPSE